MYPLLFMVCMEYLSRILYKMSEMAAFKFHPRCKEMKLTHMCFAENLIMCSKGEFSFVYMLLSACKLFSTTSGLKANMQ